MENILKRQTEIFEAIEKIGINFRKDPADRKTEQYLLKRLDALDVLWAEFLANHDQLDKDPLVKTLFKSHDYFLSDRVQTVTELYMSTKTLIENFTAKPAAPPMVQDKATLSQADELKKVQSTNFRAFQRVIRNIHIDTITEKWEIEDKLQGLQAKWKVIDELHWRIDNLLAGSDAFYELEYNEHEMLYEDKKRDLHRKLNSAVHQYQATPQIEIPQFSGNYTQWPTFMDLFTEAIHNNNMLSKAQKMQHLKGKLKGEAERLVQHLHISGENYDTCWELLHHRYNNIQLLFTKQIQAFMNQPNIQVQSAQELKRLHDVSMETIHAIQNMGVETVTWDPILVHILSEKLDPETYASYMETRKAPRELPILDEFMKFIEGKFTALEPLGKKKGSSTTTKQNTIQTYKNNFTGEKQNKSFHTYDDRHCPFCKENHLLIQCKKFNELSPETKIKTMSSYEICNNCLYCHNDKKCASTKRCKTCSGKHHTSLHDVLNKASNMKPSPTSDHRTANHVSSECDVLLATIQLRIMAADGSYQHIRALLDQGSQLSLITEHAAQRLGLKRHQHAGTITGIGLSSSNSKGLVNIFCESLYGDYAFTTEALVMKNVLNSLPNESFEKRPWSHLQNIQLADPEYNISSPVDLLLGAGIYSEIVMDGLLRGSSQAPVAQQTKIGWILFGNVKTFNCHVVLNNIEQISQYWEMEDISSTTQDNMTSEEEYCEQFYTKTTTRQQDGRYVVRIPMKPNFETILQNNKASAVAQFKQLEKRMSKNTELSTSYKKFMQEYIDLQHMKLCNIPTEPSSYLPHHGVLKPDSTTTKLRVVFNASSKTKTTQSLNELMLNGPNLQQDLQALILRWRNYRYVYTADIEKFYRQIMVHEQDQHLQKIVWRDNANKPLDDYQLCSVTYGTKSAPFLAMRTIRQLAIDYQHQWPEAANILQNQLYVDDLLAGGNNLSQVKDTQIQLIKVLQDGGFNLRKFASNNRALLEHLPKQQISEVMLNFKHSETQKTLGLQWDSSTDSFIFTQDLHLQPTNKTITKRELLSEMSRLYDPLGWLSPVSLKIKLLFQEVWSTTECQWDDNLPQQINQEWSRLKTDMKNINNIRINRSIGNTDKPIELHGFCDASEKAYSCVIYCKSPNNDNISINIVAAKTRLAPVNKKISLPRLELCGALLLSRLMKKVKECMASQSAITIYAWTDSMVVLGWLQGNISRWKTFVANRVGEILAIIPASNWRHVKSENNAADCASRGLWPSQLTNHTLWWEGPQMMKEQHIFPLHTYELPTLDMKRQQTCALVIEPPTIIKNLLQTYNSMTKTVRTLAWISRFITNARNRYNKRYTTKYLTADEINCALTAVIKYAQLCNFDEDIRQLTRKAELNKKSNLLLLNPYLDSEGVLRVGGRLHHSSLPMNQKHPIILPQHDKITELLIAQAHLTTLHGGARLTLSYLRQKYWVIGGNKAVKKQIRTCVKCHRFTTTRQMQLMSDLPEPRVTPSRPFTHTGVDFTGQVEVKANKGRGIKTTKGYIAVFICLSTKAIHLELVSDLSSSTFLAAFKRLCARRGTPTHVYSDNGTNFVGAAKILNKEYKEAMQHYLTTDLLNNVATMGVQWTFTAPSWPTANGLWEAGVKSMKYHLKRVLGEQKLTFEEFTTLLTQIEACLNSRPLMPLTDNIEDLEYISPGHFLVGGPLLHAPESPEINTRSIRTKWQLIQHMLQGFWSLWSKEYLHTLQTRPKWRQQQKNLQIGNMVLVKDDNIPAAKWILGRVIQTHPGSDGLVRVVSLKTKNGTFKRPVTKLSLLPIETDDEKQSTNRPQKQNDDDHSDVNKTTKKPGRKQCNLVLLATLFALSLITPVNSIPSPSYNLTKFNQGKMLYFDKIADVEIIQDEWKMVVYYNMTSYWESFTNVGNYINYLKGFTDAYPSLYTVTSQYEQELVSLRHQNTLLTSHHKRMRRGLVNGVGYLANSLFGTLDERFAEQYDRDIEKVRSKENHLINLYKKHTSIIESEYNIIKRNEEAMNKQFKLINNHFTKEAQRYQTQQLKCENGLHILSGALVIGSIITNLHRVQQLLLDTITDVYNGRVDSSLLQPEELQQQLNTISGQLPKDLALPTVPTGNSVTHMYKLLRVHTRVQSNFLIFEAKLPLVNKDEYELHKTIPIPFMKNGLMKYIVPTAEYMVLSLKTDKFIYLEEPDLQTCTSTDDSHLLCHINRPIYNLKGSDNTTCEAEIINSNNNAIRSCRTIESNCNDKWIQLHTTPDSWFYTCCMECALRIFCPGNTMSQSLTGTGIISLGHDCLVKTNNFVLRTRNNMESKITINTDAWIMPPMTELNTMINDSAVRLFEPEGHIQQFDDLKQQITEIKHQQESLPSELTSHDIHHYTAVYLLFGLLGVAAVVWFWKKWRNRKTYRTPPHTTQLVSFSTSDSKDAVIKSETDKRSLDTIRNIENSVKLHKIKVNRATSPILDRHTDSD